MAGSRVAKYVYDNMEEALGMASAFETLFTEEGVYIDHGVIPLHDNRVLLEFTIKTKDDTTSTS